jgi:hypothetical protein
MFSITNKLSIIKSITKLIILLISFNLYKTIIKQYFYPTKYTYLLNTHNKIQLILNKLSNF